MELTGLTTDTASYPTNGAPSSDALGKDAFMGLLVEQMKNQDPMNPQSNEDFIAQLASFSSLEQMEQMNQNLLGMALLEESNALLSQLTEGAALIGKQVSWTDPTTGIGGSGIVDSIKLSEGLSMLQVNGLQVPLYQVGEISEASTPAVDPGDDSTDLSTGDDA
jgi:flagellar basal-body rod modification protein FlgD